MHTFRPLLLLWMFGALTGCATELDFDSIAPTCEGDAFDVLGYDQYCSGEVASSEETALDNELVTLDMDQEQENVVSVSATPQALTEDQDTLPYFPNLTFTFTPRDELLTAGSPDPGSVLVSTNGLDLLPLDDEEPIVSLTVPRRTRILDGEAMVAASLLEGMFDVEGNKDYAQVLLVVDAKRQIGAGTIISSRLFGLPNPVMDIAAVPNGEEIQAFLAAGALGIKPLRYRQEGQSRETWREVPAFDVNNDALTEEIIDYMADYTPGNAALPRSFCRDREGVAMVGCASQCRTECGQLDPLADTCFRCRIEQNVFHPLPGETTRSGAYSLETVLDTDGDETNEDILLVGNNGSLDSYDVGDLELPLTSGKLGPVPSQSLPLQAPGADFSPEDYIVTEILHHGDRIAFVFQDRSVVPESFNADLDPVLPAYLGVVDWSGRLGAQMRVVELPSAFIATNRVRLALMDNNLVVVRALQTKAATPYEESKFTGFRGLRPFTALFEDTGAALRPLYSWEGEQEGSQDQHGMIHNASNGRLLVTEEGVLRGYRINVGGNLK